MSGVGAAAAKRAKGKAAPGVINRGNPPARAGAEADKTGAEPRRGRGRPPHEPTAETRRQVEAMAVRFVSRKGIAAVLGIGEDALRKHYAEELEAGDGKAELNVRTGLWEAAKKGNVKALIHLSETKLGDAKTTKVDANVNVAGGLDVYLRMGEDELKKRLAQLDEALAE